MGSSDDEKVMYSGDYDLLETRPLGRHSVADFKRLVKNASRVGTITDVKVGEVAEWNLLQSSKYNAKTELKRLGELWQEGVLTSEEVRHAKNVLKPHLSLHEWADARKELRFGVLRWTPQEVASGVKKYRGRVFYLEDAFKTSGITKLDLVAWVKDKYVEVSNIILWTHGGKPYADVPRVERSLAEDILRFEEEGRYMKVAKRMYSIAKVRGLVADQEALLGILNSHLGALYILVSDLEVLVEFPKATSPARRREELDLMRDRMGKLFYGEFANATNPKELLPRLREVLERETKKALEELKLLPLSKYYKP